MDCHLQIRKTSQLISSCDILNPSRIYHLPFLIPVPNSRTKKAESWKLSSTNGEQSAVHDEAHLPQLRKNGALSLDGGSSGYHKMERKRRVFFLDVNPLCYRGSTPSLDSFAHWISLFFSQVSLNDPVVAVLDGEGGNEHRRQLLPSYKANRKKMLQQFPAAEMSTWASVGRSKKLVMDVLQKCNVPVVKIKGHEADDVVTTLVHQVLHKGYQAVIASPDKDFKQLISEDVQMVMPIQELDRWSFYTLKHYVAQYNCDPQSDLSLRCILGDEIDGVPGIQHHVPGFGRKTALKLLKKHRSLENLLSAASVRSVGRQYAQEALTKYADFLRKNYEVLSLKRDVNIQIEEQWLVTRDAQNDSIVLSSFMEFLSKTRNSKWQYKSQSHEVSQKIRIGEEGREVGPSFLVPTVFCSSVSWLALAQVARASEEVRANAVYEVGELFELGIQLSYLLLLLALLGAGTFFVIRQVLVRRELDLSAKELQEQVRSGDASATELFELGAVMLRRKFYPAATKYLLQAIEKWDGDDQDLAQVYNALGVTYIRDGKTDKGIAQFQNAVKLQPGYVTAWNNLGDAYEKTNDLKSALKAFEEVLLFDPNNTVARPRRDDLKAKVDMYRGVPVNVKTKKKQ
ncbi:uncharacterized protein LOC131010134 [Salvia miltiorrhiza]|uniref:uncharacterized protein LOC131010134 n=1 Tax=Salvia miltiorrhiza TaxID=226208 RepID=UPI0025ACDEED|nr:uncharacterized protein LOC131010134 [Salvia miltiorrhiza]